LGWAWLAAPGADSSPHASAFACCVSFAGYSAWTPHSHSARPLVGQVSEKMVSSSRHTRSGDRDGRNDAARFWDVAHQRLYLATPFRRDRATKGAKPPPHRLPMS